jgi:DNA invertase Pin-like site-specific DNA recombinase
MNPGSDARNNLTVPLAVVALAGLLSTALLSIPWRTRRRRTADPETATARSLVVVGYTTAAGRRDAQEAHAAIDMLCQDRGWSLTRIIQDAEPESGRMSDRPGLFEALEMLASDRADGLVVNRLRDLTTSASDLAPLMRWIEDAHARVVVLDVSVDTATEAGRTAVRALAEVGAWKRQAIEERTRRLATRASGRGNGRPSVRDDPELVAWIGRMRADGMSLQAIADALDAKGVPTLRGGARWRPSSVQSAVGYKRPPSETRVSDFPRIER